MALSQQGGSGIHLIKRAINLEPQFRSMLHGATFDDQMADLIAVATHSRQRLFLLVSAKRQDKDGGDPQIRRHADLAHGNHEL